MFIFPYLHIVINVLYKTLGNFSQKSFKFGMHDLLRRNLWLKKYNLIKLLTLFIKFCIIQMTIHSSNFQKKRLVIRNVFKSLQRLLHRHTFCQVSWHIDITTSHQGYMI